MASSPLVSVWLSPRDTIERVVANRPRASVWLIAALAGISVVARRRPKLRPERIGTRMR